MNFANFAILQLVHKISVNLQLVRMTCVNFVNLRLVHTTFVNFAIHQLVRMTFVFLCNPSARTHDFCDFLQSNNSYA